MRVGSAVFLLTVVLSSAGCALAPIRIIDAGSDATSADRAMEASADGGLDVASDAMDAREEPAPDAAIAESGADAGSDATIDGSRLTGPAGTPLGQCTGARAIGSTAIGVRPVLPWSNTTLTTTRSVFQGRIESDWSDARIVIVNDATDNVVYTSSLTALDNNIKHNLTVGFTLARGSYRWMLCARDLAMELRHSAEWRFRVSGTAAPDDGRAGMIPLVTDLTGDGYPEVIVGAPNAMNGGNRRGIVRVYSYGVMGMVSGVVESSLSPVAANDAQSGFNAVMLGDVNGDGRGDFAVASPGESNGGMDLAGAVRVYFGQSDRAMPAMLGSTFRGTGVNQGFGGVVAGLGDINGDGLDDFAIGAPNANSDQGLVRIYIGRRSMAPEFSRQLDGLSALDAFGWSVAGIGDINADGLNDVAISALRGDTSAMDTGSVSIWLGQRSDVLSMTPFQSFGRPAGAMMATDYGFAVSAAGDVNEDGYADILVGSPTEGHVYVLRSNGSRIDPTSVHHDFTGASVARFGRVLLGGFDFNADHHADVVISAPNERSGEGTAYLWLGTVGANEFDPHFEIPTLTGTAYSAGLSLGIVGDIYWGRSESAGSPTLLIGAPGNIGLMDPGQVLVVHGHPAIGLDNTPAQRTIAAGANDVAFGSSTGGPRAR